LKVKDLLKEVSQPSKPRGGHRIVYASTGPGMKAKKIHSVKGNYVYVDTGTPTRGVIPISDLEYVGHGGLGHIWKLKQIN